MSPSFWRQWNLGILFALAFYSSMGMFGVLLALGVIGEGDDLLAAVAILGIMLLLFALVFGLAFFRFRAAVWHEPERMGRASAQWSARVGALLAWVAYLLWAWWVAPIEGALSRLVIVVLAAAALLLSARRRPGVPAPGFLKGPQAWFLALAAALLAASVASIVQQLLTWGKLIPEIEEAQALWSGFCVWLGIAGGCAALSWLLAKGHVDHLDKLRPALRVLGTVTAFLLPGTPQIARGRGLYRHAFACLLGTAALLHLSLAALNLSNHIATFDILESIATPNLGGAYPSTLSTTGANTGEFTLVAEVSPHKVSLERLRPIWTEGSLLTPGIHFWDGLVLCTFLYLALAFWSLRDHLKARAGPDVVSTARRVAP